MTTAAKADRSVASSGRRPPSEDAASMPGRKSSTFMAIPCRHELKRVLLTRRRVQARADSRSSKIDVCGGGMAELGDRMQHRNSAGSRDSAGSNDCNLLCRSLDNFEMGTLARTYALESLQTI